MGEAVRFLPADPPTPARMTAVLAQVHEAVLTAHADDDLDMDPTLRACVQRSLAGPHLAPAAEPVAPPPLTLSAFGMHLHAATTVSQPQRHDRRQPGAGWTTGRGASPANPQRRPRGAAGDMGERRQRGSAESAGGRAHRVDQMRFSVSHNFQCEENVNDRIA